MTDKPAQGKAMTVSPVLNIAANIFEDARNRLRKSEASRVTNAIRQAQIRMDMMAIGYEAVKRKIAAGHPYGTVGITLGTE